MQSNLETEIEKVSLHHHVKTKSLIQTCKGLCGILVVYWLYTMVYVYHGILVVNWWYTGVILMVYWWYTDGILVVYWWYSLFINCLFSPLHL